MHLLSALSSTTSPLAMQAMPLVAPAAGDFAALIADMVPAGDAAVMAAPVERQAAAPAGNGLPVAIAAPVALVEMPVVAAPPITPPLPVSATEAVLMLPVEAEAPTAAPVVAPVAAVAVAIGVLANLLPDEEKVETPPRAEDVAVRALPMPVPTRFAAPLPRVKRAEPSPREDAPVAREDKGDEPDQLVQDSATLPVPQVIPQPVEAVVLPPTPVVADPAAAADPDSKPAVSLVIEQGEVVAAEPVASTAPPMRMAKRRADAMPAPLSAQAPAAAARTAAPVRPAEPAVGVVTPLNTDGVVPVHVVVPPVVDDVAAVPDRPAEPRIGTVASPAVDEAPVPAQPIAPHVALNAGSIAPPTAGDAPLPTQPIASRVAFNAGSVASPAALDASRPVQPTASRVSVEAGSVTPVIQGAPMVAADVAALAVDPAASRQRPVDMTEPVARTAVGIDSQPDSVPSAPRAAPASTVSPSDTVVAPQAIVDGVVRSRPIPTGETMPDATATLTVSQPVEDRVAVLAPAPAVPTARSSGAEAIVADMVPVARQAEAPIVRPLAGDTTLAARAPISRDTIAPVPPASQPAPAPTSVPLPDVAPAIVARDSVAPVARREAVLADRAPMTGEAAAPVVPVAALAAQSAIAAAPVTRIAPVPLPNTAPVVEASVEGVTVRHTVDAPATTPATPPVTRVSAAPVPDVVPMVDVARADTDTLSPRPRRDEDLSAPATGGLQAADAAVLRPVAPTAQAAQPALDTRQPQWVEGMIDRIATLRESSGANTGETRIRLSPDALGDVEVAIRTGDDGKLHVHIASENADAGRLLAEAQPRLVQMAEARGLKLGGMQVDVGSQQSQQSQRQAQDQGNAAPRAPRSAASQAKTQTTRSTDRIA
ncbi:MAG: flagellar hook-length control protein FliK [Sphingomonas paucimobilis]